MKITPIQGSPQPATNILYQVAYQHEAICGYKSLKYKPLDAMQQHNFYIDYTFTIYSAVKRVVTAALVSLSHVSCEDIKWVTITLRNRLQQNETVSSHYAMDGLEGWGGGGGGVTFGGREGGSPIVVQHNLARSNWFF